MCPKPFSWAKNKRKLVFRREVERTALSESGPYCSKSAKRKQITPILGIHFLKVQTAIGKNKIKIHGILLA